MFPGLAARFGKLGAVGITFIILVVMIVLASFMAGYDSDSNSNHDTDGGSNNYLYGTDYGPAGTPRPQYSSLTGYTNDKRWKHYKDMTRAVGPPSPWKLNGGGKLPFPLDMIIPSSASTPTKKVTIEEPQIDITIKDVDNGVKINDATTLADAYPKPKEVDVEVEVTTPPSPAPTPSPSPTLPMEPSEVPKPEPEVDSVNVFNNDTRELGTEANYVLGDPSEQGALPPFNPTAFTVDGNAFKGGDAPYAVPAVSSSSYLYNTQNYYKQPKIAAPGYNTTFKYPQVPEYEK